MRSLAILLFVEKLTELITILGLIYNINFLHLIDLTVDDHEMLFLKYNKNRLHLCGPGCGAFGYQTFTIRTIPTKKIIIIITPKYYYCDCVNLCLSRQVFATSG